jgi:hypothetical protein
MIPWADPRPAEWIARSRQNTPRARATASKHGERAWSIADPRKGIGLAASVENKRPSASWGGGASPPLRALMPRGRPPGQAARRRVVEIPRADRTGDPDVG